MPGLGQEALSRAGAIVQPGGTIQTFLIFLMSLSSSLGAVVWVDWTRSWSLSRDAICSRNTGQLSCAAVAAGTTWWQGPATPLRAGGTAAQAAPAMGARPAGRP